MTDTAPSEPPDTAETPETAESPVTPIWHDLIGEYGDPTPVFDELSTALANTTPPEIDEAHGVVDAGEIGPVQDPGPSKEFATVLSTPDTDEPVNESDEVDEVDNTASVDTNTGDADA